MNIHEMLASEAVDVYVRLNRSHWDELGTTAVGVLLRLGPEVGTEE